MQIMGKIIVNFNFHIEDGEFATLKEAQEFYESDPEYLYENGTEEFEWEDTED